MKKKVSVITIMDVPNFGSMLQAYATGELIERKGYDVEFIDYIRPGHSVIDKYNAFIKDDSLGGFPKRFAFGIGALFFYSFLMHRLRRFVKSRFRFSKQYLSLKDLQINPPLADLYMTGSDQVWNSKHNKFLDKALYLDFTKGKKVAFSSSVGIESFPISELETTKQLLCDYKKISVRESQTQEYFKSLGFSNTEHVLDPTLILNAEEWKKIVGYKECKHERYLLVYSVERFNNDFIFSQAKTIARELGLKTYVISATYPVKAKKYGIDKIYSLGTVKQFISLIADAEFVIASSFHGTAFSLNFNKDFITIAPEQFNIRMESLVNLFGVSDRIVTTRTVCHGDLTPIDYTNINRIFEMERAHALKVLEDTLNV